MVESIPAMWMRGGTSKALYLLQTDISSDAAVRDRLLLRIMGSPDTRQIDGLGGADPLTSKIAIISASDDPKADIIICFCRWLSIKLRSVTVRVAAIYWLALAHLLLSVVWSKLKIR